MGKGTNSIVSTKTQLFVARAGDSQAGMRVNFFLRHLEGVLWSLAVLCLILAAVTRDRAVLAVIAAVWIAAIGIVIPLHFWRAWHRLPAVIDKTQYAVWVGLETVFILALVGLAVYGLIDRGGAVAR